MRMPQAPSIIGVLLIATLLLLPLAAYVLDKPYWLDLMARILTFAIAAVSLGFIVGYVGLVSLGHAVFLLCGAYVVVLLSDAGFTSGYLQWAAAVVGSMVLAAGLGAIALRTTGIHFIMLTLALSQMIYFALVSMRSLGGDSGLPLSVRSDFGGIINLYDPYMLYFVVLAVGSTCYAVLEVFTRSPFGLALAGCRSNERRMKALGHRVYLYKLIAFVVSGGICGLAGAMLANVTGFVSPEYGSWMRSGELLVAVILGGVGTLIGPLLGALVLFLSEHFLSGLTLHWPLIMGPVLVMLVLFMPRGLWNSIQAWKRVNAP